MWCVTEPVIAAGPQSSIPRELAPQLSPTPAPPPPSPVGAPPGGSSLPLRSEGESSLDSLEALLKKRDDLDKAITAQVITNIRIPIMNINNNNRNSIYVCSFMIHKYLNLLFTESSEQTGQLDTVA